VVDRAFDGEKAISRDSEPYDAVVLDYRLPKWTASRYWRHGARNGRVMPVLILDRARPLERQGAGFRSGADDYVAKPFILRKSWPDTCAAAPLTATLSLN